MDADAVELRVLGCLIEKQRTTPDQYPLSLNALRLACNQSTNREPVVAYDEPTIREGLDRLSRRGWVRLASGRGSRAVKYRHLFDEALSLDDADLSLLAVLMLRGPQTPAELRGGTERLHPFADVSSVEAFLAELAERSAERGGPLVIRLARAPGEREARWAHLLSGPVEVAPSASRRSESAGGLEEQVARLLVEVEALRAEIAELRARFPTT